ncbi:MAG: pilin [Candidatus Moranbacteria bacterium]|nr:pilin [Candidatus Moranbacteria bacterium]
MKKIFYLAFIFLVGLNAPSVYAAAPKVQLACGTYGGINTVSTQNCQSGESSNQNVYTTTGFKCCLNPTESNNVNRDAGIIIANGYSLLKTGEPTSGVTFVSRSVALSTPYSAPVTPPSGGATPPSGGGTPPSGGATPSTPNSSATCTAIAGAVCASVSAGCPSGKTAQGTCGNQGNCCVPTAPTTGGGAATPSAPVTVEIDNPLEYDTVEALLDQVMGTLRNIVVILALVFLVIGGLLYITSAGNDKRISAAKAAVTAALVGLAIVMIAPSFLKEIGGVLGWTDLPSQASGALSLTEIATNVLNFLLGIIGILAIIMFLVGAVMYLTSAGDDKKAGTAKDIVKYAIIGMIVTFSALVIVRQIADFFVAS